MEKIRNKLISLLHRLTTQAFFRSLRIKVILGVSLILVVVMGTFTYYDAVTRVKFYLKKQEERAFDISDTVMKGIEYPMLDGEMEDVQAILQKLGMLGGLEVVNLCDLTGTIRYSKDPDNIGKVSESEITRKALRSKALIKGLELHGGKKIFSHALPIHNEKPCFKCHGSEKDILGVLMVGIDWGPIEERIAALRNREITLAVISLLIVAFFLIRWLSKYITQPIFKVTGFADEVSRGNLNVQLDLGEKVKCWEMERCDRTDCPAYGKTDVMCWYTDSTHCKGEPSGKFPEKLEECRKCIVYRTHVGDEIVQLGDSFAHMLNNMREMYEKISSFSKDLELQVAKRTEELEQKTVELERANIELKMLDELRSTFLANMSHELRTPLNSIIGYTDLLLDRVDGDITKEQANSLTKVHNNAKNLLKLINDVLDMSRIESGRVELDLRTINLQDIIQTTVSTFEPLIDKKGLMIHLDFDERAPLAYADPDRVRQVVTNLLDNAIKFTSEGSITLSIRPSEIGIEKNQPPKLVEVCVSDTGIGIREEDINKLFDKFTPLDISATRPYGGVGLGLSICKGLVEVQNGSIWAKSKYGEGSRFCFTLPVKEEGHEEEHIEINAEIIERIAQYFKKPMEVLLQQPQSEGRLIRCWEYHRCAQTACPAYGDTDLRCWLKLGTYCRGLRIINNPEEKAHICKDCDIIKTMMGERPHKKKGQRYRQNKGKKTILTVDDHAETIELIRKYLQQDYQVVGVLEGDRAVEKAREIKPFAITLDILMPGKDGWETLQKLKETPETQDIPIIILSIMDNKKLGFSLGAAEYLVKPINKEVLLKKLRKLERIIEAKEVLVVDDKPDQVELISKILKEEGYQITKAYDGEKAIESIKHSKPDLVILDIMMPKVSGFDVIEHLKAGENTKEIPIIVITGKELTREQIDVLNGRVEKIVKKGTLGVEGILEEVRNTLDKFNQR